MTGVYNPKAFFLHAASLRQACAHCGRFSTAASRRSLASVSVPVCPADLSVRVPVVGLVGRHPANYLIGLEPLPGRKVLADPTVSSRRPRSSGDIQYYPPFPAAILVPGADCPSTTHPFATYSSLRTLPFDLHA